uniref:Uncharacterized protein n=1 Tax=Populus trichocarpa TaxID=3694 RepID=A0A3N7FCN2_POPTR
MILLMKGEKTVSLESEAISSFSTNHSSSGSALCRKKLEKSIARKNSSIQWK